MEHPEIEKERGLVLHTLSGNMVQEGTGAGPFDLLPWVFRLEPPFLLLEGTGCHITVRYRHAGIEVTATPLVQTS